MLDELIARAVETGAEGISSEDAFMLHDTYGFPIEMTIELVAEHGLGVDEAGFETLMNEQRDARAAVLGAHTTSRSCASGRSRWPATRASRPSSSATRRPRATRRSGPRPAEDGRVLVKLVESPFYATGGGQVADAGYVECFDGDCRARVDDVLRIGGDQVVVAGPERGTIAPGERVRAIVDRAARHATECNHTATHLLHAALRRRLGTHVRQAGSYVGPDKLRFDFTHGKALTDEELRDVEQHGQRVGARGPAGARADDDARRGARLGAMALFGEKYGDVVRMVEVGDGSFSRELCGGTHVRFTAEIGLFKMLTETSSAANVRRIEAVTGPAAVALLRHHDQALALAARELRATPEQVPELVAQLRARVRELERGGSRGPAADAVDIDQLAGEAYEHDGATMLVDRGLGRRRQGAAADPRPAQGQARRRRDRARLGRRRARRSGRERGAAAGRARRARRRDRQRPRPRSSAAAVAGATRWPAPAAATPRSSRKRCGSPASRSRRRFLGSLMRVLALDYGSARCGCAVSDPTGVLATPIEPVANPASKRGLARLRELAAELEVERVVVGLPLSLSGGESAQTERDAGVCRAAVCGVDGPGRALRRAVHDAARRALRWTGERGLAGRGPPARELARRARRRRPLVADERTAEEREAARLERERRRAAQAAPARARPSRARAGARRRRPSPARTRERWRFGCRMVNRIAIVLTSEADRLDEHELGNGRARAARGRSRPHEVASGTRRVGWQERTHAAEERDDAAPGAPKRKHSWRARILAVLALVLVAALIWFLIELFQPFHGSGHGSVTVHDPAAFELEPGRRSARARRRDLLERLLRHPRDPRRATAASCSPGPTTCAST